jgi:hypothetical protein
MTYAKGMPGAARETLRWLVDHLPEAACETACQALLDHLKKNDPVLYAFATAPEDDPTEDEIAAIEEAYEAIARGEPALSDEELKRELGL